MNDTGEFLGDYPTERVISDIMRERVRQVVAEGHMPAHDDGHDLGELARAAASHALRAVAASFGPDNPNRIVHTQRAALIWPFPRIALKEHEPRRHLVIAAALIVAEIERLDRDAARTMPKAEDAA